MKRKLNYKELELFVEKVSGSKSQNPSESEIEELKELYSSLRNVYSSYSSKEILKVAEKLNQSPELLNFLRLGLKHNEFHKYKDLFSSILDKNNNLQPKDVLLSNFVKSFEGHKFAHSLINGDYKKDNLTKKEIAEKLGGKENVTILTKIMAAFEFEKLGSLVGYILSGNFDICLERARKEGLFDKSKEDDLIKFILEDCRNKDCHAICSHPDDGGEYSKMFPTILPALQANRHRGAHAIDHCFINFENKTITIGNSSCGTIASQKDSFTRFYLSFKNLTQTKILENGKPNPYFGFKLNPFFVTLNAFPSSLKPDTQMYRGREFVNSFELNKSFSKELNTLGMLKYFSVIANVSDPYMVLIEMTKNPQIFGIHTKPIWGLREIINDALNQEKVEVEDLIKLQGSVLDFNLNLIEKSFNVLSSSSLSSGLARGALEDVLTSINGCISNIFYSFSDVLLEDSKTMEFNYFEKMKNVYDAFVKFEEKEKNNDSFVLRDTTLGTSWRNICYTMRSKFKNPLDSFLIDENNEVFKDSSLKNSLLFNYTNNIQNQEWENNVSKNNTFFNFKADSNYYNVVGLAELFSPKFLNGNNRINKDILEDFFKCLKGLEVKIDGGDVFVRKIKHSRIKNNYFYNEIDLKAIDKSRVNMALQYLNTVEKDLKQKGYDFASSFLNKTKFLVSTKVLKNVTNDWVKLELPSSIEKTKELSEWLDNLNKSASDPKNNWLKPVFHKVQDEHYMVRKKDKNY